MKLITGTVLTNEPLTDQVFRLTVNIPVFYDQVIPGQFCHLRIDPNYTEPLLRRPISIANFDPRLQILQFVIKKVGTGTQALARLAPGQKLDLFGPLGNGFPIKHLRENQRALLLGGGVGIPPLLFLAKHLAALKVKTTAVLGFRTQREAFLIEEFSRYCEVKITSDDGTLGNCGNVCTELTSSWPQSQNWEVVYACGPLAMLRNLETIPVLNGKEIYVSLEKRMACGIGACTGCTCQKKDKTEKDWYYLVCKDGPVFKLGEVELSE